MLSLLLLLLSANIPAGLDHPKVWKLKISADSNVLVYWNFLKNFLCIVNTIESRPHCPIRWMVWNIYGPDVKLIPISLKYSIFALNLHPLVSKQSMHQDRQKRTSDNRDKFLVVKFLKLQYLFSKQSMHHLVWQLVKGAAENFGPLDSSIRNQI